MRRADDYLNTITQLGTLRDKSVYTSFSSAVDLTVSELDGLYEHEPLAARIVDRIVDDAIREGFEVADANEEYDASALQSDCESLDVMAAVGDAWRWARLYGGAILIIVADDGLPQDKPLALDRVTRIRSLQVVESPYVTPGELRPGLGAAAYRNPETYTIASPLAAGAIRKIHRSRVIRFDGVRVPPSRLHARGGWGPSVLDRVWVALRGLGSSMGYAGNILHELSAMFLKLRGFREQAAASDEDTNELKKAFEMMKWAIDNLGILVLDSEDEYGESTRTVTGLDALLGRFVDALVRSTDMPRTILLGEQPSGLNATASSEVRAWFDHVHAQQGKVLTKPLTRIVDLMLRIRERRGESVPTKWTIGYPPLWQATEDEKAKTRLTNAQADMIYLDQAVISADEVRAQLVQRGEVAALPTLFEEEAEVGT